MKRVIAMVITLGLAFTLFAFPVFAAYPGAPVVSKPASSTVDGVEVSVRLDQYYPVSEAQSGAAALEYNTMFYYRLYNTNDQDAYITNAGFLPQWVTAPYSIGYECYTEDLKLAYQSDTGRWYVYASSDFVYNTGIVVPAHTSLCCVGVITGTGQVSNNGNTLVTQVLSSVTLTPISVTLGSYQHGTYSTPLEDIEDILQNISDQLSFSGTITEPVQSNYKNTTKAFESTGFYCRFFITNQPSFVLNEDTEILSGTDYYQSGYKVIPIYYRVRTDNQYVTRKKTLKFDYSNFYTPLYLPRSSKVTYVVGDCVSQVFMDPILDQSDSSVIRLQMPFKYTEDGHGLLPYGNYFTSFVIYLICPVDFTPSFPAATDWVLQSDNTFTTIEDGFYLQDTFYLRDINISIQDLLDSLGSGSYSGTIDDSDDLQTTEAAIHAQEQQWYADNQTAIEATGLGNYQYSQGLISSFGAARYQIAQVWNALGDYTYVYYIVFLLGLATYILRHEPSMKTKQRRAEIEEAAKTRREAYQREANRRELSRSWGFHK